MTVTVNRDNNNFQKTIFTYMHIDNGYHNQTTGSYIDCYHI